MSEIQYFTGLIEASEELKREVDEGILVSDALNFEVKDIENYKALITPENNPANFLRLEFQRMNDCNGNSITTCVEVAERRGRGRSGELSRMMAYQLAEKRDGSVGANRGSSIHSAIRDAKEYGYALESEWDYTYCQTLQQLIGRMTPQIMASAATRRIAGYIKAPPWKQMLALGVLGNPLHWGTGWPVRLNEHDVATSYAGTGSSGHAWAGVFPTEASNGQWLCLGANSHGPSFGNKGYFWFTEDFYEECIRQSPYGAYVVLAHKDPLKVYYDPTAADAIDAMG